MTPRQFSVNCAVCGWAVLDSKPFVYMYGSVKRSRSVFIVYDHSVFDLYWSNFGPTSFHMNSTIHENVSVVCRINDTLQRMTYLYMKYIHHFSRTVHVFDKMIYMCTCTCGDILLHVTDCLHK